MNYFIYFTIVIMFAYQHKYKLRKQTYKLKKMQLNNTDY